MVGMQLPQWLARFNRHVTNPIQRIWAGWAPTMGILEHVGRRSGNAYRTPLTVFSTEEFTLSDDRKALTCPAGETTTYYEPNKNDTGVKFRYSKKQCGACALRDKCLSNPKTKSRTVIKNDYEAEYKAAQMKAQTPEYARIRKEHPAIERKLSELVCRHDLRNARYRGLSKVLRQALLTGVTVNLKRMVKLCTTVPDPHKTGTVRAELVLKE